MVQNGGLEKIHDIVDGTGNNNHDYWIDGVFVENDDCIEVQTDSEMIHDSLDSENNYSLVCGKIADVLLVILVIKEEK